MILLVRFSLVELRLFEAGIICCVRSAWPVVRMQRLQQTLFFLTRKLFESRRKWEYNDEMIARFICEHGKPDKTAMLYAHSQKV